MAVLDSKRIVGHPEQQTASPPDWGVALSRMAWAMVTHAGISCRSWPSSAGGVTRKRNCNRCEVKCGESAEARRWIFASPAHSGGTDLRISIFEFRLLRRQPKLGIEVEPGAPAANRVSNFQLRLLLVAGCQFAFRAAAACAPAAALTCADQAQVNWSSKICYRSSAVSYAPLRRGQGGHRAATRDRYGWFPYPPQHSSGLARYDFLAPRYHHYILQ